MKISKKFRVITVKNQRNFGQSLLREKNNFVSRFCNLGIKIRSFGYETI